MTYTVTGTGGCDNATATRTVTVTTAVNAGDLTGTQSICVSGTTTFISDGDVTGTWSSVNTSVATVDGSGEVTGVASGTTTIRYIVAGSGGCSNDTATRTVTVTAAPVAGSLSGLTEICLGSSLTITTNGNSGGVWSSSDVSVASVGVSSGFVNSLSTGSTTITYLVTGSGGCSDSSSDINITVNDLPTIDPIEGITSVCSSVTNLSNNTDGGVWTTSNSSVASVSIYGVVSKVSLGSATITYTVTDANGCVSDTSTIVSFVNPPAKPDTVYGLKEICFYINQDDSVIYHVKPVTGAVSYDWYLPTGITSTSSTDRYIHGESGSDSLVVIFDDSYYSYGAIYVSAVSGDGCNSEWIPLWIFKTIPVLSNITGAANVCFANNTDTVFTYHVDANYNGSSISTYNWELPAGATIDSGSGTNTVKVRFDKASFSTSYIKVTGVSNCGNTITKLLKLTKLVSATPVIISGPTNPCIYIGTSDSATYSIRKIDGAASYNWIMPTGATAYHPAATAENDTIIKVIYNSSIVSGSVISVQSVGCNVSATRSLTITRANPSAPQVLTGVTNVCSKFPSTSATLSDTVIYRTNKVANATLYTWIIPSNVDTITTLVNRDTFIVVKFKNTFTSGVISVKAISPCGESALKSIVVSRLVASTPIAIQKTFVPSVVAVTNVSGLATDTLRIRKVTNATSYYWRMTSGNLSVTIEKLNASGLNVNDTAVVIHLPNGFTRDTVAVSGVSTCNISAPRTLALSAMAIPPTPNAISDTVNNRIPCIGDTLPYRASAPSPTSLQAPVARYRWTLPTGAVIISTNGDSSLVRVKYNVGFVGGTISVKSVSAAGVLSSSTYSITLRYSLATPTNITSSTGNYQACVGSPITYTVVMPATLTITQRSASVYRWTIPANSSITSATSDSSNITLQYNLGFTTGSISVRAQSSCGVQGAAKSITLTFPVTATPAAITSSSGNLSGCIGGTLNYTVTPGSPTASQSATSVYRWTIPANTVITSAITDSSQITLQFNAGYTSGSLSVKGQSACGAIGAARAVSLLAPYLAPTPSSIISSVAGNYNGCIGSTKTFTAATSTSPTATQQAAVKYRWTLPANTSIASASSVGGVDSASIVLQFNTGYTGGVLSVKGVTACGGVGGAKSQTLTHTGCPTGTGAIFTKSTQLNTDMSSFEAVIYPNPTTTDFRINLNNPVVGNEKIGVKIFDLQGRMVQSLEFTSLNNISFGNNLKSGIYMVHISQGKQTQTKRVVKY
jgi:hypothetical protein